MKKKLVIFDLDGTLLNTAKSLRYCVNQALKINNEKQITLKQTIAYVGNGAKKLIERACKNEEKQEAVFKDFNRIMNDNLTHLVKPYPYIKSLLKKLKSKGVKIAVFSNKPHWATTRLCNDFFTTPPLDYALGHKENAPLKPNPNGVLEILSALNIKPEECVLIGDGETDAQTAINAHVDFIGVLWGFRSKQILEEHGAKQFALAPSEILNLINL